MGSRTFWKISTQKVFKTHSHTDGGSSYFEFHNPGGKYVRYLLMSSPMVSEPIEALEVVVVVQTQNTYEHPCTRH